METFEADETRPVGRVRDWKSCDGHKVASIPGGRSGSAERAPVSLALRTAAQVRIRVKDEIKRSGRITQPCVICFEWLRPTGVTGDNGCCVGERIFKFTNVSANVQPQIA